MISFYVAATLSSTCKYVCEKKMGALPNSVKLAHKIALGTVPILPSSFFPQSPTYYTMEKSMTIQAAINNTGIHRVL